MYQQGHALTPVKAAFFDRDAGALACSLLGRWLCHRVENDWLILQIVECEAYFTDERASHSSLGETPSRRAMFMAPGTIYMYHSRGGDSLNFSAHGAGNAVLIKAAKIPDDEVMLRENIDPSSHRKFIFSRNDAYSPESPRAARVASGQCLLCRCLDLRRVNWNAQSLDANRFYVAQGQAANRAIQCRRLGISAHRDADLMLRFVDARFPQLATQNPLTRRKPVYRYLERSGKQWPVPEWV